MLQFDGALHWEFESPECQKCGQWRFMRFQSNTKKQDRSHSHYIILSVSVTLCVCVHVCMHVHTCVWGCVYLSISQKSNLEVAPQEPSTILFLLFIQGFSLSWSSPSRIDSLIDELRHPFLLLLQCQDERHIPAFPTFTF